MPSSLTKNIPANRKYSVRGVEKSPDAFVPGPVRRLKYANLYFYDFFDGKYKKIDRTLNNL
jgi:hypothetical protein